MSEDIARLRGELRALDAERRMLRAQLDEQCDRASVFFNSLLDASLLVDSRTGTIVEVNDAACRMIGCERQQLDGRHFTSLFAPEPAEASTREELLSTLRVHGHVFAEQQFVRDDGSVFHADISAVMLQWAGRITVLLSLRDSSERRQAEQERIAAERLHAKLETISRLSHEINNPLQELVSRVELDGNAVYRDPVDRIVEVLERLRREESEVAAERPPAAGVGDAPAGAGAARPMDDVAILVVDDEVHLRKLFEKALRRAFPSIRVDLAVDGQQGVACFSERHYALVLMDVEMPVMRGDDAFREMLARCEANGWTMPPVVFCTGFNLPLSVRHIVEASSSHICMLKPVHMDRLMEVIAERLALRTSTPPQA